MRMVTTSFDATGRSIARANIRTALKGRRDIVWVHAKVKSPMMGGKTARQIIGREQQRWSSSVGK